MTSIESVIRNTGIAMSGLLLAVAAHGQDLPCKALLERMDQLPKTPHHQFVSMGDSVAAKAAVSESISTGTAIYVATQGVWRNSGFTPAEMSKREAETRRHKKSTCSVVRDEVLVGENATLYRVLTDAPFGKMDSQVWVSKATGLPLLEQYELDDGTRKSYYEVRFVYTGIEAPAGF